MNYSVEELPPPMNKAQAWQRWWYNTRGRFMVAGGAHPMEHALYDAFMAGWEYANKSQRNDDELR